MFELVCEVCEETFESKSARAKVCGSTCRSRKRRAALANPKPAEDDASPVVPQPDPPDGLVASLIAEFERFGVLDTVDGQLALQLARQVTATGATGVSSLSKEFRAVRADALAQGKAPAPAPGPSEPVDVEVDEVEEARKRRDAKARAAAASS